MRLVFSRGSVFKGELLVVAVGADADDVSGRRRAPWLHRIDECAAIRAKLFVGGDLGTALITCLGDHIPPSEVLCHGYARVGRQNLRTVDGLIAAERTCHRRRNCGGLDFCIPPCQSLTRGVGYRPFSMWIMWSRVGQVDGILSPVRGGRAIRGGRES